VTPSPLELTPVDTTAQRISTAAEGLILRVCGREAGHPIGEEGTHHHTTTPIQSPAARPVAAALPALVRRSADSRKVDLGLAYRLPLRGHHIPDIHETLPVRVAGRELRETGSYVFLIGLPAGDTTYQTSMRPCPFVSPAASSPEK
jgi:hypothetical protein